MYILLSKFLWCYCLHFTKNIAYHIPEMLIFCADEVLTMGRSGNSRVLNFAILLKMRKLDAHEIFMFYSVSLARCLLSTSLHGRDYLFCLFI